MADTESTRRGDGRTAIKAQRRKETRRLAVMCGGIALLQLAVLYLAGAIQ